MSNPNQAAKQSVNNSGMTGQASQQDSKSIRTHTSSNQN